MFYILTFTLPRVCNKRELMKRGVIRWEGDDDGTRLPGQWVSLRIFISSSFIDTQAERDMIVQVVLPELNHELQKNFVRVTFVDLRWGVASHESDNCESIQRTCLNEIERCIESSPTSSHPCPHYPLFVCLRTKRKGWVMDKVNSPQSFEKPDRFEWIEEALSGFERIEVDCHCFRRSSPSVVPVDRRPSTFDSRRCH